MTLKERIKADLLTATMSRQIAQKLVLSTLIGELDRKRNKEQTDAEVIRAVKTMVENCKECGNTMDIEFLTPYLPKTLTDAEIDLIISDCISIGGYSGMRDMGKVMRYLSDNYPGMYDGTTVSARIKQVLN